MSMVISHIPECKAYVAMWKTCCSNRTMHSLVAGSDQDRITLYLSVIAVLTSAQMDCTKGKENQISVSTESTVQV